MPPQAFLLLPSLPELVLGLLLASTASLACWQWPWPWLFEQLTVVAWLVEIVKWLFMDNRRHVSKSVQTCPFAYERSFTSKFFLLLSSLVF